MDLNIFFNFLRLLFCSMEYVLLISLINQILVYSWQNIKLKIKQ